MNDSCYYCGGETNDFVKINKTDVLSGVEFSINRQGMLRARTYQDIFGYSAVEHELFAQDVVILEYCPFCGRKF